MALGVIETTEPVLLTTVQVKLLAPDAVKVAVDPGHTEAADAAMAITGRLFVFTAKVVVPTQPLFKSVPLTVYTVLLAGARVTVDPLEPPLHV